MDCYSLCVVFSKNDASIYLHYFGALVFLLSNRSFDTKEKIMGIKLEPRKPLPITCPNDGKVQMIRMVGGKMQAVYLTKEQVAEQERRKRLIDKRWSVTEKD